MLVCDFLNRTDGLISKSDSYDIISSLLNIDYNSAKQLDLNLELPIDAENIITRLKAGEPTAYIINRREFYSNQLFINENVLIPRFETEILVENAINLVQKNNPRILDLCTGSGCILLSILKNVDSSSGVGIDISESALEVARINAKKMNLNERVSFINNNALTYKNCNEKFDMVTCNPPYVSDSEYSALEVQVKFEPRLALVADDGGLFFYKNILMNARNLCKVGGLMFFEIGYRQSGKLSKFANSIGYTCDFIKDYSDIDRVMVIQIK